MQGFKIKDFWNVVSKYLYIAVYGIFVETMKMDWVELKTCIYRSLKVKEKNWIYQRNIWILKGNGRPSFVD